ncbi:MAG TPA: nitrous oxide reductase family maturation protein NosD [Bacteroidetes bacterium]|nr:periplasmic copper-binding protein [bacterium BMS3Bbin04]HDO66497.1 nitrous oxide reductase family maturation protein NosD [Bacteroidota bacterium]HEX05622.1 nitrous oxide reductase family maturation protein NosD [Bacteroidota bacterium]
MTGVDTYRKLYPMLLVVIITIAIVLIPATGVAAKISVIPGQNISSIIHSAAAGDTVWLAEGEYLQQIIVDVPVVLTGENLPYIRGGYEGHVVQVSAPGAIVDGLHISEAGERLTKDFAAVLVEADSVTIRNCLITRPLHGIYVKGGSYTVIENNRIEGRLDLIEADRGNGIHLWYSKRNEVNHNEILNVRDGIYFSFTDSTNIRFNSIHHVRYGLHYMYSDYNLFEDNTFILNVAGAALMYSSNIMFRRNIFAHCRGFRAYGILYQSMDSTFAYDNLIYDNSRGIFINNSSSNHIANNDVFDNDLAIQMNGGSERNVFEENNFVNNLSELLLDVTDRETAWSGQERGNHWSSYTGYDLDGDGIGDVPFDIQNVFQVMEGSVPEVRFYLLSPAAAILEIAERTMPILKFGGAVDDKPIIRPVENSDVPWDSLDELGEGDRSAAILYTVITIGLFGALLRMGRLKGKRKW